MAENAKTYHVSKRNDGMWQVKYAGGEKAIKLLRRRTKLWNTLRRWLSIRIELLLSTLQKVSLRER